MSDTLVIYHANCTDGLTAAWSASKHLENADTDYLPAYHGQDPPDVKRKDVYILDFSYKKDIIKKMADEAKSLVLLDHHKSAAIDLASLTGIWKDASTSRYILIDITKSGAMLSWEHFNPGKPAPKLVKYVQDRDLWKHELSASKEINAYIRSYPQTFESLDKLNQRLNYDVSFDDAVTDGIAILRGEGNLVNEHIRNAREITVAGDKVLCVNASCLHSEIAGKLAEGRPFGVAWFKRADGKFQWSLRSRKDGKDVSLVAGAFGGGGHPSAAGFQTDDLGLLNA